MYLKLQPISQLLSKYRHIFASLILLSMIYDLFSRANTGLIFILAIIALLLPDTKTYLLKSLFTSWFGLIVLCFMFIITLHALFPKNSWHDDLAEYKRWMIYLEICVVGLFFKESKWRARNINVLLIMSLVLAIFLFLQNKINLNFITKINNTLNKNIWYESQPMFFVFTITISYIRGIKAFRGKKYLSFLTYLILIIIMLFSILENGERIGILALCLIIPYISFSFFKVRGVLLRLFLVLAASTFMYAFLLSDSKKTVLEGKAHSLYKNLRLSGYSHTGSIGPRIDGLRFAFVNFKRKPLWGYGLGTFTTWYPTLPKGSYIPMKYQGSIETYYVSLILQLGLIGFTFFVLLMCAYWKLTVDLSEYEKAEWRSLIIVILIGCLTFTFLFSHSGRTVFLLSLSVLIGNCFHNKDNNDNEFNLKKLYQFFKSSNYRKKNMRKLTYKLLNYTTEDVLEISAVRTIVFQGTGRIGDSLALLPSVTGATAMVDNVIVICTQYNVDIFKTIPGIKIYKLRNEKSIIALFIAALVIRFKFGKLDVDIISCSVNGSSNAMLTRFLKAKFNFSFGKTEIPFVNSGNVSSITTASTTVANNAQFMSQIGFDSIADKYQFFIQDKVYQDIENYLTKINTKEYVAINFTGYDKYRKFNEKIAAAIIQKVQSLNNTYLSIILLYMPGDIDFIKNIESQFKNVFFYENMPNIYYSAALIKRAKLLVSPDTALVHFASAFNIPTLGFYTAPLAAWRPDADLIEIVYFKDNINSIDLSDFYNKYTLLLSRVVDAQSSK